MAIQILHAWETALTAHIDDINFVFTFLEKKKKWQAFFFN